MVQLAGIVPPHVLAQVLESLKSGIWADSKHVQELEKDFAKYIGTKFCRAVSNGTAALLAMIYAADLKVGDEVIVPSFSFIATANCLLVSGATPKFVDIDPATFNLDPDLVSKAITPKTKAILPVHLYGLCADMAPLQELAEKHNLILFEDACQAHGATYKGKKAGNLSLAGAFSLYPTKNMICGGEGGLVTTNDETFINKVRLFVNHGQTAKYVHEAMGFNFRLIEIAGIIGKWSLSVLDENNQKRAAIAKRYNDGLAEISQVKTPIIPEGRTHVFHQYTIRAQKRDKLAEHLQKSEIGYGIHYGTPIHLQQFYKARGNPPHLPITEQLAKEVISLPIHPSLTDEQVDFVIATIKAFYS